MNSGYGSLAATGASVTIGGVVLEQGWLIAGAIVLVVGGALCVRWGFRRNKSVGDV